MSRKPVPPAPPTSRVALAIIALLGALFGSGLTFLALRPHNSDSANRPGATHPDPTVHRPAPELTAGQTPAQADRTLGNFYYDHRNWPMAVRHYEAAIRQGSDDADVRTDLGNAYRFSGRADDALLQYQLAQRMDPAHEFSLFNQGGLFLEELKQPAKAVETWQEYLTRFPHGRSVDAARQLIAQVQGVPATAPAAVAAPAGSSTAESLILKQIEAARSKESRP